MDGVIAERGGGMRPEPDDQAAAQPPDFLVGDWLVQPSLGRVSRGTSVQRLRPQLMDVLVCLAARRGRTVMKQEVITTIWNDRFVTESALARTVAELRRVLGDDAKEPRIIETIPKRGYRIIAPVTPSSSSGDVATRAGLPCAQVAPVGPLAFPLPRRSPGRWPVRRALAVLAAVACLLAIAWVLFR